MEPEPVLSVVLAEHDGDQALVVASGEVDMHTTSELERVLGQLTAQAVRRLVVDLTDVSFCDSTGLSTFVTARNRIHEEFGGVVVLVGMHSAVRRAFDVTGLTEVFECHETLAEAMAVPRDQSADGEPATGRRGEAATDTG